LMSLCFPDTATTGFYALSLHDALPIWGGSPVLEMLVPLVPLTLGEAVRSRRDLVAYALAEREREAERRVAVERARMAREVHDLRSEEHTSELQSRENLVCRLLLEKKKT